MAQNRTYTCDVCGATKGEANHWWLASVAQQSKASRRLTVSAWDEQTRAHVLGAIDVCGSECLHTAVTRYERGESPNGRKPEAD